MFIYPENLKAKAKLWLWELRDLAIGGIALLLSALILAIGHTFIPFVFAVAFAFLSIRHDNLCVLDFILFGVAYFLITPQQYEWRRT